MNRWNKGRRDSEMPDGMGVDPQVAAWLHELDPEQRDPGYWLRFHARVMDRAAPVLARRRLMAELTLTDVMSSWARAVIPTAVLAAAAAALIIFRGPAPTAPTPVAVDDLLLAEVEGVAVPAILTGSEAQEPVAFAVEQF